jgi:threonine/homoserine/homoserine lactone efflux protein
MSEFELAMALAMLVVALTFVTANDESVLLRLALLGVSLLAMWVCRMACIYGTEVVNAEAVRAEAHAVHQNTCPRRN